MSGQWIANSAKWVAEDMRGRKILDVARRGKVLFFKLSPRPFGSTQGRRGSGQAGQSERVMAIHLRMSGRLEVAKRAKDTKDAKERWMHFCWKLNGGWELRFIDPRKFGRVWYGSPAAMAADPYLGSLGVDAKTLLPADFAVALGGYRGMVKPLLLRQDIVAGIGNILADGALRRLGGALQDTIRSVLASGGTSMRNFRHPDGNAGRYQDKRLVYGKAGKPCPRCHAVLRRIVVGSRGTTVCPNCQPYRILK